MPKAGVRYTKVMSTLKTSFPRVTSGVGVVPSGNLFPCTFYAKKVLFKNILIKKSPMCNEEVIEFFRLRWWFWALMYHSCSIIILARKSELFSLGAQCTITLKMLKYRNYKWKILGIFLCIGLQKRARKCTKKSRKVYITVQTSFGLYSEFPNFRGKR